MTQRVEQFKETSQDGLATKTTRVVDNDDMRPATDEPASFTAARVIWFIAGVILALLAFRFVLVLLGANPANGFVDFIYDVSYPFAAPFFGMFSYAINYGVSRVELSTLVAIAVYALVAYGLAKLVTIRRPA